MLNVAYIFPGQGAQYVGMGEEVQRRYPPAKEVFERANNVLGFDLAGLIFKGPFEELSRTLNCQVAVFTVSVACLRAFQAQKPGINVRYTAGLSLGEYTALVAAEALDFEEALRLVRQRAQYMEEAAQQNPGGMISLIGLPLDTVKKICEEAKVEIANLNCPGQVVISGSLAALEKAKDLARACGARRVIPLKVSGAFHSSLMTKAAQKLAKVLEGVKIRPPRIPVISNVTAAEENSPEEIKGNLARQVASGTRWEDSINFISSCGIRNFIEIGPGKVLRGLLRKIDPQLKVYNIETVEDLESFK
ncbi:MAG: ACP S-malonyltransferase [Candidatus Omnitrophica bacterium]|nr:ACP S-malonyltransferase [Candidatus Omnitrophota bacterium]MBU4140912.1 ACP S-malonyltransferase [Candidatus Omnitrophota bacterium]